MEIKVKIGTRIKALRELKGMSQKDLAYECKMVNWKCKSYFSERIKCAIKNRETREAGFQSVKTP